MVTCCIYTLFISSLHSVAVLLDYQIIFDVILSVVGLFGTEKEKVRSASQLTMGAFAILLVMVGFCPRKSTFDPWSAFATFSI